MPNSKIPPTSSYQESSASSQARNQPLKHCDKCGNDSEPLGGVQMRDKWYCSKCWIKFSNRK
jgi:hypothetical protein